MCLSYRYQSIINQNQLTLSSSISVAPKANTPNMTNEYTLTPMYTLSFRPLYFSSRVRITNAIPNISRTQFTLNKILIMIRLSSCEDAPQNGIDIIVGILFISTCRVCVTNLCKQIDKQVEFEVATCHLCHNNSL